MRYLHLVRRFLQLLLSAFAGLSFTAPTVMAEEAVAVFSQVFNGYARVQLPDKTFKPERYSFGEGGCWTRPADDPAMEKLKFVDVARVVAGPLQHLNYLPARDAKEAELLILVFWGSTQGSRGQDSNHTVDRAAAAVSTYNNLPPQPEDGEATAEAKVADSDMESALWQLAIANSERDKLDNQNARILGYTESLERARFIQHMSMGRDVLEQLGGNRYFVVLQAYDFRTAAQERKLKPLWFARISISERGDFAKALERMTWSASRFFGQDSRGLRRPPVFQGSVELGPLEIIEEESPK